MNDNFKGETISFDPYSHVRYKLKDEDDKYDYSTWLKDCTKQFYGNYQLYTGIAVSKFMEFGNQLAKISSELEGFWNSMDMMNFDPEEKSSIDNVKSQALKEFIVENNYFQGARVSRVKSPKRESSGRVQQSSSQSDKPVFNPQRL